MDIRPIYSVQVRREGSEKVLIYIDGLNEKEADKVFRQLRFNTRGEGYEKLLLFESGEDLMMTRKMSLK
ncbi:hypothetical protein [Rufibacter soli]